MRKFPGTRAPSTDFDAVRSDLQTTPLYIDVSLTAGRSLAAGNALELTLNGNVLYIDQKSDSGFATLHFNDDARTGNTPFTVFPGFVARVPYVKIILENLPQPGMVMRIIYGVDLDFTPAVSAGVFGAVSVIDGGKARTLANVAYSGQCNVGAVGAQYSHGQIYNPVGSGVNCFIEQFIVSVNTAGQVNLYSYSTPLTTDLGSAAPKLIGGALSQARIRRENNGAQLFTIGMGQIMLEANSGMLIPLREPLCLPPGTGVLWLPNLVNVQLSYHVEFWEESQ